MTLLTTVANGTRQRGDGAKPTDPYHQLIDVTVVVPTRNESANVEPLVRALAHALANRRAEVIFVDDSDDDTPTAVRRASAMHGSDEFVVRLIARTPGDRCGGLSGAVLAGLAAAENRWACVMDGDLQHPPECINRMMKLAATRNLQLVCASRHLADGTNDGLSGWMRKGISQACGTAARNCFSRRLASVSDPMTGFFLVDTASLHLDLLRPHGFKILLEILVSHPELRVDDVPFVFGERTNGESKANWSQGMHFARQLVELRSSHSRLTWRYAIHDLIGLASDRPLPELEKFLVRRIPKQLPMITVRVGDLRHLNNGESIDLSSSEPIVSYRERTGFAMSLALGQDRTDITVSSFVARSPHVLYTNVVEPVLRWRLVELGVALVHAACFADDDSAYLVTARTDTGKTTTMLKVLDDSDLSFVSDDLIIMSPEGLVWTFPKPLTISQHTVHALHNTTLRRGERLALIAQSRVHSREGRRMAFLLTKYRLPVASINAIIQRLIPPPKYHVERLVRGVRSTTWAPMSGMFIIQRGGSGDEPMAKGEALEILLANCDDAFGFPPYSSLERLMLAASTEDLRSRERAIISAALGDLPVLAMRSESLDWAERIPAVVAKWNMSPPDTARRARPAMTIR